MKKYEGAAEMRRLCGIISECFIPAHMEVFYYGNCESDCCFTQADEGAED